MLNVPHPNELKWNLRVTHGNEARVVFPPGNVDLLRIEIARAGTRDPWDIQLNQPGLTARQANRYRVIFAARADSPRPARLGFARAHGSWDGLGLYQTLALTAEWQKHSIDFVANADDANARIHFDLGGSAVPVEVRSLTLVRLTDGSSVEPDLIVYGHYPATRRIESGAAVEAGGIRFSAVIPTYQRRELAVNAVQAFAQQDYNGNFEVIVAVDGSTDGTAKALRDLNVPFPLTVVEQANLGAAAARNLGASVARGEIILFLDDDMEAHPRLLAEHDFSHSVGVDAVVGSFPVHSASPPGFLASAHQANAGKRARRLMESGVDLTFRDLQGGQISLKREIFEALGGFDTNFNQGGSYGHEDIEFGYRLLDRGYKAVFNPYALSYQNYGVSPRRFLRQIREAGRASVAFIRKHPESAAAIFAPHIPGDRIRAEVWKTLAILSPLTTPLTGALRRLALAMATQDTKNPRAQRFFFQMYEMEFWRGVHEAGGIPRLGSVRVLTYHAISDLSGQPVVDQYGTPPDEFRKQIRMLRRFGFHFISPEQFLNFLNGSARLPRLPVLLTFDDCYSDLLDSALPLLQEFNIPALAFAVSGRTGGLNTWDASKGAPQLRLLDSEGLRKLAANGVEIGAHSRTHPNLTDLSAKELEDEVAGAVEELESLGLKRPRMFAYPKGEWNAQVCRAAKDAGLQGAFTVDNGKAHEGRDRYRIPRIQILRRDKGWRFLRKVIRAT